MIVLFLTGAIATIMIRTLRKDIAGYNEMQTLEEAQEETGWKLLGPRRRLNTSALLPHRP
jgi:transmembrane 9 superfamily protein 2/4